MKIMNEKAAAVLAAMVLVALGASGTYVAVREVSSARSEAQAARDALELARRECSVAVANAHSLRLAAQKALANGLDDAAKRIHSAESDSSEARLDARFMREELASLKRKSDETVARLEKQVAQVNATLAEVRAAHADTLSSERYRAALALSAARDEARQAQSREAGATLIARQAEANRVAAEARASEAWSEASSARAAQEAERLRLEELERHRHSYPPPCPPPPAAPKPVVQPTPPRLVPLPGPPLKSPVLD